MILCDLVYLRRKQMDRITIAIDTMGNDNGRIYGYGCCSGNERT